MSYYHHVIYWRSKADGKSAGYWPSTESDPEAAVILFDKRFVGLTRLASEPYADSVAAGSPSDLEEVKARVAFLLGKSKAVPPRVEAVWTEEAIDACLGLPIKGKRRAAAKEPDNITRVWPFPNAWGRPA